MINLFGLHLQLMLGETLPTPAPLKVSEALIGPVLTQSAGLDPDADVRFRAWLARLLAR